MKKIVIAMIVICAFGIPAAAQQTTGNIKGRIVDAQKAAVPGVTVTAKNPSTGFTRSEVTDSEGIYRLNALPVGTYDTDYVLVRETQLDAAVRALRFIGIEVQDPG